ncbi:sugar transferase [Verrucomicrobiales bacterium]|nr:sugar transferase [Verrucomicrobiales bacterium]
MSQSKSHELIPTNPVAADSVYSGRSSQLLTGSSDLGVICKRLFDVVAASLCLLIFAPLFLASACWIRYVSKGSVLFRQERIGQNGNPFLMFKFRSMAVNTDTRAHEDHVRTLMNSGLPMKKLDALGDSRIIRGGNILRASCVDELPQLWNVIRGDMSLVGPRPCTQNEYKRYSISEKKRSKAKPGMTGFWQVHGKNKTTFRRMIAMDILYFRKQSIWLDLTILTKTIPAVLTQLTEARLNQQNSQGGNS